MTAAPGGELGSFLESTVGVQVSCEQKEFAFQPRFGSRKKKCVKNSLINIDQVIEFGFLCHSSKMGNLNLVILWTLGVCFAPVLAIWGDDVTPRLRVNYLSQSSGKKLIDNLMNFT